MKLRTAPALEGQAWMRRGLQDFLRNPLAFAGLMGGFLLFALLASLLPVVGQMLVFMAFPVLSMAFMLGNHGLMQGQIPRPALLVAPLQGPLARRREMIKLGAAYAVVTVLSMVLNALLDSGSVAQLESTLMKENATPEEIQSLMDAPALMQSALIQVGLSMLVSLLFWHAPPLVFWGRQPWAQALFSSVLAVWNNKAALLVYFLHWAALGVVMMGLLVGLGQALGLLKAVMVVILPLALILSTAFYASAYFTFTGSFDFDTSPPQDPVTRP